jgi:sigma-E factor negative regulatory protein RseA
MNPNPLIEPATPEPMTPQERRRGALSALMDGEMTHGDMDCLLESDIAELTEFGQTCELIGDALRGASVAPRLSGTAFSAAMMARLQEAPREAPQVVVRQVGAGRAVPANDALFRWKMVAGLASLTAVFAVSWGVIGGAWEVPAAGPQLAAVGAPAPVSEPAQAVVVQTTQGQVLRDPRLEQLLAEHRQFGGMSALQAPAGFLRNATYDSSPQR